MKKIRCNHKECKKKLKLHEQIQCKCGKMFCINHRNYASHNCPIKIDHKKILKEKNPKIIVEKVDKI